MPFSLGQQGTGDQKITESSSLIQYFITFPPYWEELANGDFSGTHYRLAQTLYKHAGLNVEFINTPYQRMQFQVVSGKAAFINYGEVKDVNTEDILHVCVPPTEITLRVYYLKEGLKKLTKLADFSYQNIIIIHGLPLGEFEPLKFNNSINFMQPRTVKAALDGLQQGRGDYLVTFDNLMRAKVSGLSGIGKYRIKSYPLYTLLGYPIVTPKSYPNGKQLCDKVRASYQKLVEEGVIDSEEKVLTRDLIN